MSIKNFLRAAWKYISIIYFPIYFVAWLLHIIGRFILGISYFGLLIPRMGKDVLKSLFTVYYGSL